MWTATGCLSPWEGMCALNVGTWDGFWAFEMERRGAEVVALNLDDWGVFGFLSRFSLCCWSGARDANNRWTRLQVNAIRMAQREKSSR